MEKEYTIEEQIIIGQAKANGTYLKAPNGEDTNLSPKQWLQVRTAAFKEWFGDWENDKEKASKILDLNGEPVVMYHGTPLSRNQITPNRGWQKDGLTYISQTPPFNIFKGGDYSGLIFTSVDYDKAASIAEKRAMSIPDDENGNEQFSDQGYVYELYLNSKKTFDVNNEQDLNEILDSFNGDIPTLNFYGGKGNNVSKEEAIAIVKRGANTWLITETPEFINKLKALGYDGLAGVDEWVKYVAVFNPNQIKSASANIGTFSLDNDDIRYRFIGEKGAANLDRAEEATFRLDNLAVAREMEYVGKDALSIKIATGWERGADSKWRYEENDLEIQSEHVGKYNDELSGSNIPTYNMYDQTSTGIIGKLSEFISDDNLFISYPEIADWDMKMLSSHAVHKGVFNNGMIALSRVYFSEVYEILNSEAIAIAREKVSGLYKHIPEEVRSEALDLLDIFGGDHDRMNNIAYKNMADRYPEIEDWIKGIDDIPLEEHGELLGYRLNDIAKGVLSHEIQHAIQRIEGFARGGSPDEFKDIRSEVIRDINFFTNGDFLNGNVINTGESVREALAKEVPYTNLTLEKAYEDNLQRVAAKYGYSNLNRLIDNFDCLPSSLEQYYKLSGEVEARNVQSRMKMTSEERSISLSKQTEDVRREDQLFLQNSFSESMYSDKAELIPFIESWANSIHTPIEIISDINDITASAVRKKIESGHNIKGWFVPATNDIAVYLPNIDNIADTQRTIFHEAVAHYGLRKMFGEHFNTFLDNVYNNASEEIQGRIMYATHGQPSKRLVATEEYLAKLAEQGFNDLQEISFWKKVKLAFVDMLHHAGVSLGFKLHDNDLRGIIFKSYQNLAHKGFDDNFKSLSKDDKLYLTFKAAVENNDFNKFIELKEQGYYPPKEVIHSLATSFSGSTSIAVQKIFGIEMSAVPIRPPVLDLTTNDLKHHLSNVVEQSL